MPRDLASTQRIDRSYVVRKAHPMRMVMIWDGPRRFMSSYRALVAITGMIADPLSVGFAIATAFGTHSPRQAGAPAA